MMLSFRLFISVAVLAVIAAGCAPSAQAENPPWVDELILKFRSEPVGNPPQSLWRYDYNEQTVYFIPPQCCDQYSQLLDASGKVICAPDGGFTGRGDGRCPDFMEKRTNEELIWKDSRIR